MKIFTSLRGTRLSFLLVSQISELDTNVNNGFWNTCSRWCHIPRSWGLLICHVSDQPDLINPVGSHSCTDHCFSNFTSPSGLSAAKVLISQPPLTLTLTQLEDTYAYIQGPVTLHLVGQIYMRIYTEPFMLIPSCIVTVWSARVQDDGRWSLNLVIIRVCGIREAQYFSGCRELFKGLFYFSIGIFWFHIWVHSISIPNANNGDWDPPCVTIKQ